MRGPDWIMWFARLSDIDAAAKKIMDQAALKKKDMEAEKPSASESV